MRNYSSRSITLDRQIIVRSSFSGCGSEFETKLPADSWGMLAADQFVIHIF